MLVHTLACARDGLNTMEEHWGRLRIAIWANAGADHRRELQDQQESRSFVCHEKQKGTLSLALYRTVFLTRSWAGKPQKSYCIPFFFSLLQVWMTNTVGDTTHLSR